MKSKINIKKTAMLVIDVTNFCCDPNCEIKKWNLTFTKIRRIIPKLKKTIKTYKTAGGKIIYINCVPWKKKVFNKQY